MCASVQGPVSGPSVVTVIPLLDSRICPHLLLSEHSEHLTNMTRQRKKVADTIVRSFDCALHRWLHYTHEGMLETGYHLEVETSKLRVERNVMLTHKTVRIIQTRTKYRLEFPPAKPSILPLASTQTCQLAPVWHTSSSSLRRKNPAA
ncbi:hypothetical protein PILCRDRAFT_540153 [Piloderma croceum F 1598]|uniref:Uncharacterized protein n=1 Tax=Piloderma croceum (strain F 1598) TaxID=765440 RepID=A0A0C3BSG6_PILCF|nr:hypothetical protein PILCRDRAFT_540153 [Piloderma croceum F 1598]